MDRERKAADAYVYGVLFCATTILAAVLDYNKQHARSSHKIEPDGTWHEVALGCALCLTAGAIRAGLGEDTRRETIRSFVLAFLVGSIPIVVWQEWRKAQRHMQHLTFRHYIAATEDEDAIKRSPTPLAAFRQPGSETHRRDC